MSHVEQRADDRREQVDVPDLDAYVQDALDAIEYANGPKSEDVRHADRVEVVVGFAEPDRVDLLAGPQRHGQEPVTVLEYGGLAQSATVGDTHGLRPHRLGGIGVVATDVPVAAAAIEAAEALIEEQPDATERIGPESRTP